MIPISVCDTCGTEGCLNAPRAGSADMDYKKDEGGDQDHQDDLGYDGISRGVLIKRPEFHGKDF